MDAPLGVIIPAYNEEATLGQVLRRVLLQSCVGQVVVVDDGSCDRTAEVAQAFMGDRRVTVRRHTLNLGKGAALRTALDALTVPMMIVQDADLEYDPVEYAQLVQPLVDGRADVVYGMRRFSSHTAYSYWYIVGNWLVCTVANLLYNCYLRDIATGYKAMRTDLMRRLNLRCSRFAVDAEITGRVLRLGYRIHEVPISYYARSREEGKKVTWRDGLRHLVTLLFLRLAPKRQLFGEMGAYRAKGLVQLAATPRMPQLSEERSPRTEDRVSGASGKGL